MGRRKIEIQPITHERNRAVTFVKRKNGLFKKAYELGVLCSVDVAVIIFEDRVDQHPKLHQYCSSSIGVDDIVRRHRAHSGDAETRSPADFGSAAAAGTKKAPAQDMEDDDEDEDEEAAETPVRGARGRVTAGRAPNPPSRPTPNVSAVRSAPALPRRSLPLRQAAAKRRRYAEDDEDEDGDEDDDYKQRNEDEDAEGDEDADGDYEYTGPGASRRSSRMAEAVAEVRRTAGSSLPVSNDRSGGERSSRNKRARVDEGSMRSEAVPRTSGGEYTGNYRGEYGGGYREEHSSSGYQGSGLHLHSRSRSPPHRSSYPYPYPSSGPGSSSYPPSGPGMSGYGGPGSYQSPGDIYSYPPPNPPPNPYPAPHTHSYPQQLQSYTRGPHRPFHTGTGASSPIPGSPHSFSTSSPHPYPPQSHLGYPAHVTTHQQQNGYNNPPQLRLEPSLRSEDSYLRADALYPPSARPDSTYIPPPGLPSHLHAQSQYTLPPLDPAGPAASRRTPPRKLRSHAQGQGRTHEEGYEGSVGRRGSGLSSMLDLPPVPVGGDASFPPGGAGLGLPAVGSGAAWEGAGTARELLNAFLASQGPGSSSGPGTEHTSAPGSAVTGAGESGELDWPVHVPSVVKVVGSSGSGAVAGDRNGGKSVSEENTATGGSVSVTKSEIVRMTPEVNADTRSTGPTATGVGAKVDAASTGNATSSSATNTKQEPAPEQGPPASENTDLMPENSDRRTPVQKATAPNSKKALSLERPLPGPPGGKTNEVDWLDFLSGAAAEAHAAQRAYGEKAAAVPDSGRAGEPGYASGGEEAKAGAGTAVGADTGAGGDDENVEDAEGEPDIEEDEVNVNMGETLRVRRVAPAATDSNASSLADEDQAKISSVEVTSSPKTHEETTEEPSKVDAVNAATTEDTTSGSPKDQGTKDEAGDNMVVDRAV